MIKVFVVGRHKPDFGDMDIEVVGQSAVLATLCA